MKTDNEDTLRVTLTFRRESSPEWYALLLKTTSGRARAELVRQHLTLPRFNTSPEIPAPAPMQAAKSEVAATVSSSPSQENNNTASVSEASEKVNSSDVSPDKSSTYDEKKFVPTTTVNMTSAMEPATINSNFASKSETSNARGGMAAMVNSVKNNENDKG
jgi:hypothetical protein